MCTDESKTTEAECQVNETFFVKFFLERYASKVECQVKETFYAKLFIKICLRNRMPSKRNTLCQVI